jgi:hypothetical protein
MSLAGTPSASASAALTASFAFPFSGFAVTRIFRKSPSQPSIDVLEEPGTTLTFSNAKVSTRGHRAAIAACMSVEDFKMRIEYQSYGISERINDAANLDVAADVLKRCMRLRTEAQQPVQFLLHVVDTPIDHHA